MSKTKSNLFYKTYDYLSEISNIRNEFCENKMSEVKNFIDTCLQNSDIYDFINSRLKINEEIFNITPKKLLRELLNYTHDQGDIFLSIDINIREEYDINHIKLTNYRKLLEIISSYFLFSQDILMSEEISEYYTTIKYYNKLKDYLELGVEEIPPYRKYDYEAEKMIYYESKPINVEIDKLKDKINNFDIDNTYKVKKSQQITIKQYVKNWWETYKKISQKTYPELCHHFSYYNGVDLQILVSKNNKKIPNTVHDSDLAFCFAKKANNSGSIKININNYIKEITFLDEELESDYEDVTIDLGLNFNFYEKENTEMIMSSIKKELNEELMNLFELNFDELSYKKFTSEILNFIGMEFVKDGDKEFVKKNNFLTGKSTVYKVIRLDKDKNFNMEKVLKYKHSSNNYLIICQTVVTQTVKNKFADIDNIIIKDVNDFISQAKKFIFKNESIANKLIDEIIYPFLKENIIENNIEDSKLTRSENLIKQLKDCPLGLKGWRQFEHICYDIINFVFKDSFSNLNLKKQARNYNGKDIRDIILSNTGNSIFWNNVRQIYNCNNVVIECKNLDSKIGNEEFRQISDYLGKEAIGQFGIIFSRKGLSSSGKKKQRDYLHQRPKKLILVLSEQDIIDLIKIKSLNGQPEKVLEDLKFEIETSV